LLDTANQKNIDGIKVIIIGKNEPTFEIRNMTEFYSENARFDNEIVYLKADIYGENVHWFR
jgi:hypothetical protein